MKRFCLPFLGCLAILSGCTSYDVRTTDYTPVQQLEVAPSRETRLDIGIQVFEPELENLPEEAISFSGVREAESVWAATRLKETLDRSNAWGLVRVIPDEKVIMDLKVSGKILQSDGETTRLAVFVQDSAGRVWIDREYRQVVSRYAYAEEQTDREPFQGLYNAIANDLLAIAGPMTAQRRHEIRKLTDLRFAADFSPQAFDQYLVQDENGHFRFDRLPADNDPMLERIERIRLRDQMFVDVLQDYYRGFSGEMEEPYVAWRSQSYIETRVIRDLNEAARAQKIAGWLAIAVGVGAQFSDDYATRLAGSVATYGGVQSIQRGYLAQDEALLHIQTLSELGESLQLALEPSVIELQDRTVTLAGTTRDQYAEWREILREIYEREMAPILTPESGVE